jgi:hypothetical protein
MQEAVMNARSKVRAQTARARSGAVAGSATCLALAITLSLAVGSASAAARTAVPAACPAPSVIASTLQVTVSKASESTATTPHLSSRTCIYITSQGGRVVPTRIYYASPVSGAAFSKLLTTVGIPVVSVAKLGSKAYAAVAGNNVYILAGTLEIEASAFNSAEPRMVALGRKIL